MILLLETIHPEAHELLETAGDVVLVEDLSELDGVLERESVRAIVTRGQGRIAGQAFTLLPQLVAVARCGSGLDNIDTHAAANAGVLVVHAPGSTTHAVAEHALMLMLALARRLVELDVAVKDGDWTVREGYDGIEMRGKRLGVIGLGAIGTRVARLGKALAMDVVCATRGEPNENVPRLSLDELFQTSDVVQLCVPLTETTTGLVGAEQFATMKPGALLINTASSAVVDHQALADALDDSLGGYAADVWDPEPPWSAPGPLSHPRTLVTPHVAGLTDVTYREICVRTVEAVVALLSDQEPDPRFVYRGAPTVRSSG